MQDVEFKIKKIGKLKYTRLKSLSILRKEINSYGYEYKMSETKELLDSILNDSLKEYFNLKFKLIFDEIFDNIEYIEFNSYQIEGNFPNDWTPPIG